jgi:uncharacterized protein (DUF1697 family)
LSVQIALFRGINVGKAKRVAMADLKAMIEELGFTDVRTLLNSGNVVFQGGRSAPAGSAKRIAAALTKRTGIVANALVLESRTLMAVIAGNPFADLTDDHSRLLVGFHVDAERAPFEALKREFASEAFAVGADACYLHCPDGILHSRIGDALVGPKFRDRVTTRSWATALKLEALAAA